MGRSTELVHLWRDGRLFTAGAHPGRRCSWPMTLSSTAEAQETARAIVARWDGTQVVPVRSTWVAPVPGFRTWVRV